MHFCLVNDLKEQTWNVNIVSYYFSEQPTYKFNKAAHHFFLFLPFCCGLRFCCLRFIILLALNERQTCASRDRWAFQAAVNEIHHRDPFNKLSHSSASGVPDSDLRCKGTWAPRQAASAAPRNGVTRWGRSSTTSRTTLASCWANRNSLLQDHLFPIE